jgi:hypothetical protein
MITAAKKITAIIVIPLIPVQTITHCLLSPLYYEADKIIEAIIIIPLIIVQTIISPEPGLMFFNNKARQKRALRLMKIAKAMKNRLLYFRCTKIA